SLSILTSVFKNGFIRKSSSLTIWKADKTIFKIVCKVLNVCLYDKHQKTHSSVLGNITFK
ncbi:hypothetical protein, partial [Vibrio sp. B1ASS3]|uniref:hypothetical protein n=1 Tax=Vibrio sp. B1ASS3 TaxID=2751176 RepID=UPI001ABA758F